MRMSLARARNGDISAGPVDEAVVGRASKTFGRIGSLAKSFCEPAASCCIVIHSWTCPFALFTLEPATVVRRAMAWGADKGWFEEDTHSTKQIRRDSSIYRMASVMALCVCRSSGGASGNHVVPRQQPYLSVLVGGVLPPWFGTLESLNQSPHCLRRGTQNYQRHGSS